MKFKLVLLLLLSLLFFNLAPIQAKEKTTVRVGLSNQNFSSREFSSLNLISENMIRIIDMSQNSEFEAIEAYEPVKITISSGLFSIYVNGKEKYKNVQGPLVISSNAPIGITDLNRKGTPAKYLGMLELRATPNNKTFYTINVIDMENYLRGVVPNEMPVGFGLEALKAQAVAARNYATNAAISPYFDVVDSTASQVYYGVNSYKEISDKAVETTKGIYAIHRKKPITALYFSTSAGITDDWDDVFADFNNKGIHPYLKSRYDNFRQKALTNENDVKDFYSRRDTGLDVSSPKFRWNIEFDRAELEAVLNKTLLEQSRTGLIEPKFDGSVKFEGLKNIKPIKRTQSGKVVELLITSDSGDYRIKKELTIRRVLKKNGAMLPSANFYVETEGVEVVSKDNKEDEYQNEQLKHKIHLIHIFDEDSEKLSKTFKFIGGGFGHGVGMSQFGAAALAKQGKKYPEILNHYYTNIEISTIPKDVLYNDYNVWYKTDFYYEPDIYKSVYLFINNQKNANEFNFKINDLEFNDTASFSHNRLIKINITQYLKKGLNTITFAPLTLRNKGKIVTYQVEFLNGR